MVKVFWRAKNVALLRIMRPQPHGTDHCSPKVENARLNGEQLRNGLAPGTRALRSGTAPEACDYE
jgi:hypothetical protein